MPGQLTNVLLPYKRYKMFRLHDVFVAGRKNVQCREGCRGEIEAAVCHHKRQPAHESPGKILFATNVVGGAVVAIDIHGVVVFVSVREINCAEGNVLACKPLRTSTSTSFFVYLLQREDRATAA